jgi:hypothetical protein
VPFCAPAVRGTLGGPAMEACVIDVFATARKHGLEVNVVRSRTDPQHYFGLVLVE